ncbi:MAG: FKBP-type peptidyl-prolyl cis-trans isomerase N-terminal domain-containing protein [Bacteroidia bacterium]
MKRNYTLVAVAALALAACSGEFDTKSAPKTLEDSFSYAVGLSVGKSLASQGITSLNFGALIHGMQDAMSKDSGFLIEDAAMQNIQQGFITEVQAKITPQLQEESKKYMAEVAKTQGVENLDPHGFMKSTKAGNGPVPQAWDTVELVYTMLDHKGIVKMENSNIRMPVKDLRLKPLEQALAKTAEGGEFELYIENEKEQLLRSMSESFKDRFAVTVMQVKLVSVSTAPKPAEGEMPAPSLEPVR